MDKMRVCKECGKEKILDDFQRHKNGKDGYAGKCRDCATKNNRQNYKEPIEAVIEVMKKTENNKQFLEIVSHLGKDSNKKEVTFK